MTRSKRLFDILFGLFCLAILIVPALIIAVVILVQSGGPVLYRSERMNAPGRPFTLWKFRTMSVDRADSGVSGGDKTARITPIGRFLRRSCLDEVPQLWNILKGDMSFVGPRPPLRLYVERFPALYAEVLRNRPGVTGLASLRFHRHEEWILAQCHNPDETDFAYSTRCVHRKARIDLIYRQNYSLCYDLRIVAETAMRVLGR